ncbi:MAG: hypothetical protein ACYTGQ_16000 [Planctomycetota bacterium]
MSAPAFAETEVTVSDAKPPEELAEAVRAELASRVIQLADDGEVFYEFWLCKEVALPESAAEKPAIERAEQGLLIGALRVHEERYDFRDEEIPPGVYTLRFCAQPDDGDHLGTSPTIEFVLLIPADADPGGAAFEDTDAFHDAASVVNAAEHPGCLNIQPVEEAGDVFPRLAEHEGGDHLVVYLQIDARAEGQDKTAPIAFGLVYEGYGEL